MARLKKQPVLPIVTEDTPQIEKNPQILNLLGTDKKYTDVGNYQILDNFLVKQDSDNLRLKLKNYKHLQQKMVSLAHDWKNNPENWEKYKDYIHNEQDKTNVAVNLHISDLVLFERSEYCLALSDFESTDEIVIANDDDLDNTNIVIAKNNDANTPIKRYTLSTADLEVPDYIQHKEKFKIAKSLYLGLWINCKIEPIEKKKKNGKK
jgi:hypothetical protein